MLIELIICLILAFFVYAFFRKLKLPNYEGKVNKIYHKKFVS